MTRIGVDDLGVTNELNAPGYDAKEAEASRFRNLGYTERMVDLRMVARPEIMAFLEKAVLEYLQGIPAFRGKHIHDVVVQGWARAKIYWRWEEKENGKEE